jgi:hypothetical protein
MIVTPLVARVIALTRFRHTYGVMANPEDLPGEWAECLAQARVDIDESLDEFFLSR